MEGAPVWISIVRKDGTGMSSRGQRSVGEGIKKDSTCFSMERGGRGQRGSSGRSGALEFGSRLQRRCAPRILRAIFRTALGVLAVSCGSSHARAFEFNSETSCIQLNACNSDAFSFPFDCTFAEDPWCSCLRTALEKPLRGQTTGIEQGLISVFGQPGVGNQRTEVNGGTLDLSGIEVGDVIGGTQIKELVPETVAPPGTFFTVRTEYHVTAKGEDWIEFDNVHVAVSTREDNFVLAVLRYDRFDAAHSHGLQHRGRITANGEGQGFVFEYRYEAEEGAQFAAIEPSDLSPGTFNVRLVISLFTEAYPDAAGAYALPDSGSLEVSSTIRKVVDSGNAVANPDEILPLGTTDLCQVIEDPNPDDNVFPEPSPARSSRKRSISSSPVRIVLRSLRSAQRIPRSSRSSETRSSSIAARVVRSFEAENRRTGTSAARGSRTSGKSSRSRMKVPHRSQPSRRPSRMSKFRSSPSATM